MPKMTKLAAKKRLEEAHSKIFKVWQEYDLYGRGWTSAQMDKFLKILNSITDLRSKINQG